MDAEKSPQPIYKSLYFQVITAIVIGVLLGILRRSTVRP